MPQLDPSSFASQIFWLLVCFLSFYFVVANFITPKMDNILDERKSIVDKHINNANKAKEKANKLFETYEDALDEANAKAEESYAKSIEELKTFIAEQTKSLQHTLAEQTEKMQEDVSKDKDKAFAQLNDYAVKISIEIAAKVGLKELTQKDIEKHLMS